MSDIAFGKIITTKKERDAVHFAVIPTVAAAVLHPAQKVKLNENKEAIPGDDSIGIVDPWLTTKVKKGETFWLFVNPNTVTDMRHHWSHPVFDAESPKVGAAKLWLMQFADEAGLDLDDLLDAAKRYLEYGDYMCQGDRWDGFYCPEEFWDHYQVVTGEIVEKNHRGSFFSCSC